MAGFGEQARGIEDMRVAPVTGANNTVGTWADVPGIRNFEPSVSQDGDPNEGDNRRLAYAPGIKEFSASVEVAIVNLASLAIMKGGTVETSGTTPNQISELEELDSLTINWFAVQVAAPSADVAGSEYQIEAKKMMVTGGLNESLNINEWNNPSLDFEGVAVDGVLFVRRQFETAVGLPYVPTP